jgi:hypothetical protein
MVWALLNDGIRAGVAELTASDSDRVIALLGGAIVEEQLLQIDTFALAAQRGATNCL